MSNTNWLTQDQEPLFKDLIWSRPENKAHAKKILLVGGSSHGFSRTYKYFIGCEEAGVGEVKLVLPNSLLKLIKHPLVVFGDSNKDGSFSKESYSQILGYYGWADSVWLTGEFGNNSTTTMLLEQIINSTKRKIISGDVSSHIGDLSVMTNDLLLILSFREYQKLASKLYGVAPTNRMDLSQIVDTLNSLTTESEVSIVLGFNDYCLVGSNSKVVTQKKLLDEKTASNIAVMWTQFPGKSLQAMACGLVV